MEKIHTELTLEIGSPIDSQHEKFLQTAYTIGFKGCLFRYNPGDFYHPISGDYSILGITVPIQEYSFDELKQHTVDTKIILSYNEYVNGKDLFDHENHESRTDYSATVTYLHSRNLINVDKSSSWLTTDGRKFSFIGEDEWWEVDILGTPFGHEQTELLTRLYEENKS